MLRKEHSISLQHLRKVAQKLEDMKTGLWSEITLYVFGGEVVFEEPETGHYRHVVSGQYVANVSLKRIIADMSKASTKLLRRPAIKVGQVERNRFVAHNAWVVGGTRIATRTIWTFKQAGYSAEEILREYPTLTKRDINAAVKHEKKLAIA